MGNLKQKIKTLKMFKLLSAAGAASMGSLDKCDWENTAYYRYMPFNPAHDLIEAAKDKDVCLVVGGLQFIVADIDNSKHIDRCEFSSCALVPVDSVRSTPPSGTQRPKRDTMPGLSSEPNAPSTPSASDGQTSRRPAPTSSENVTIEHAFSDSTTVYMQVNLNKQYVKAYIKKQK